MPNTPRQSLPYPDPALTSSNKPPVDIQALAVALDSKVVQVYADLTARDTADAAAAPTTGAVSYLTSPGRYDYWNGTAWITFYDPTAWTSYTPNWTATTTNPTVGNSTRTGRYKLLTPKTLSFHQALTIGTTGVAGGSGNWQFSLPSGMAGSSQQSQTVAGWLSAAGGNAYPMTGIVTPSSNVVSSVVFGNGAALGSGTALASGSIITLGGIIEIN